MPPTENKIEVVKVDNLNEIDLKEGRFLASLTVSRISTFNI